MRVFKIFATLLFCVFATTACSSSDDDGAQGGNDITLTCLPGAIEAPAEGGTYALTVNCSRGEWTAFASDDSRDWMAVNVSGSLSTQGTVTLTVAANKGGKLRSGVLTVKSGAKTLTVAVSQGAPMQVTPTELYSSSKGEDLFVSVTAAAEWTATPSDAWLTVEKTTAAAGNAAGVAQPVLRITTAPNTALTSRTGTIDIVCGGEKVTVTVTQNSAEDADVVTPEGYRLVWQDEFNRGTTLGSDWTHEVKPAGWVNNELQTYVYGSADGKRVTELVDGRLRINCFKGSDGKIYSGRVYAKVSSGWQYGYVEARIKLPKGKGTWPAFWMMPVNFRSWPDDGEIDIMEEVGVDANIVSSTIHCNKYNNSGTSIEHGQKYVDTAESEFHVYACEWTAENLRFFVDGEQILNYRNDHTGYNAWPFDQPFYVILNLAWGGAWGGYNGVDESALPVTMEVDYVRVFQKPGLVSQY